MRIETQTITQIENDPDLSLWAINASDFQISFMVKSASESTAIVLPSIKFPVNLSDITQKSTIMASSDFRGAVRRGLIVLVSTDEAVRIINSSNITIKELRSMVTAAAPLDSVESILNGTISRSVDIDISTKSSIHQNLSDMSEEETISLKGGGTDEENEEYLKQLNKKRNIKKGQSEGGGTPITVEDYEDIDRRSKINNKILSILKTIDTSSAKLSEIKIIKSLQPHVKTATFEEVRYLMAWADNHKFELLYKKLKEFTIAKNWVKPINRVLKSPTERTASKRQKARLPLPKKVQSRKKT